MAVLAGASTASVLVTADAIEGFDHVDIWLRHGAVPTAEQHLVHTVLKSNGVHRPTRRCHLSPAPHPPFPAHSLIPPPSPAPCAEKQASLHVQQPLQGEWYLALAGSFADSARSSIQVAAPRRAARPEAAGPAARDCSTTSSATPSTTPSIPPPFRPQETQKVFVREEGRAVLSLDARTSGCERGRFGWPACDANWMRLSWGKDARFDGALPPGKDAWTCRFAPSY